MPPYANQNGNDHASSPRSCIDSTVNKPPVRYRLAGEREDRHHSAMRTASFAPWYSNTPSRNTTKSSTPANHRSIFQRLVEFNPCVEPIEDLFFPICCTEAGIKRKQKRRESMTSICSDETIKSSNAEWSSVVSTTESIDQNKGFEV